MGGYQKIVHPIPPLYTSDSEILILGSFPSVKSREESFFYGHPQNRFWRVLSAVFNCPIPNTVEEKTEFIKSNRLALWDVIGSCEIIGSSDVSIKNVVPNNLKEIIDNSNVSRIFVNGKTAEKYYIKYIEKEIGIKAVALPSSSPANASYSLERLCEEWGRLILAKKQFRNG